MMNFKKILLTAAALSMVVSANAFAENPIITGNGHDEKFVTGTYESGEKKKVYKVDIEWGNMEFAYKEASEGTWNPDKHAYEGAVSGAEAGWSSESSDITLKNHSNTALTATLQFMPRMDGVSGSFTDDKTELALPSAAEGEYLNNIENVPTATTNLSLSGDPVSFTGEQTVGTIMVTINDAE